MPRIHALCFALALAACDPPTPPAITAVAISATAARPVRTVGSDPASALYRVAIEVKRVPSTFTIGRHGQFLTEQSEGVRLCRYRDVAGHETIGYGHLIRPGEEIPQCITPHDARALLLADYRTAEDCVNDVWPVAANQYQFDAAGDFTFNLGCGAFDESGVLQRPDDMLLYVNAYDPKLGKRRPYKGLQVRRWAERQLYAMGD